MSARDTLTPELRAEVLRLEDDLRARVSSIQQVQDAWRAEYDAARAAERTAAAWEAWVDERVTLAAVAWVLTTVFIRFCEDNALVKPVWISGPRHREAIDAQQQFLRETARTNADVTDREWLLQAIDYLKSLPATAGLVDDTSPMWLVTPSGDAATRLLNFWRERDESGSLVRDFADPDLDTRFLGDLYQEISEDAKKRYALLQTPVFVEEFILDRTLEPALNERPLEGFKMIDPTCGSGHFLLGGFQRLLDRWHKHAPGMDERERVQAALDSVYGVDLNPFAVAIARFRLTGAALKACGLTRLEEAPAFNYHLAAGDSLLHGHAQDEFDLGAQFTSDRVAANFAYATENLSALRRILASGQYDAVVGNPPYITVKDKTLNALYRRLYAPFCKGSYALTVPFMVRFFQLSKSGAVPGWTGQITSNSFMKREFGATLIERFLPTKDLRLVADVSGAYIPGHGTPTVIVVGRSARSHVSTVRAVLGVRGEPGRPADPAHGRVWSSMVSHVDDPGHSDEWVTIADVDRGRLSKHPWSLTGGGALELTTTIGKASARSLRDAIAGKIGFASFPGADDAFFAPRHSLIRAGVPEELVKAVITGDVVRDYSIGVGDWALAPYDEKADLVELDPDSWGRRQWPLRTILNSVTGFGGETKADAGAPWWAWYRWVKARYRTQLTITFAEVATHNHFALDRGGRVFKQTAPVIKLHEGATEDEHLSLVGVLNSSLAAFWLRQNCFPKGGDPKADGARVTGEHWEERYAFNGTNVQEFPLPMLLPLDRGRRLDQLAVLLVEQTPAAVVARAVPTRSALDSARREYESIRGQMIGEQEELDWDVYQRYGLVDDDLAYSGGELPEILLGQRAFELSLARRVAAGEDETVWFERHGSVPQVDPPASWPEAYKELIQRRLETIESDRFIRLLERPEHKRRWGSEPWEKQEERALREWLLNRLEVRAFWFDGHGRPTPKSVAVLADQVARDEELVSVLSLWEGRLDVPVASGLVKLLAAEAVPYLAALRYKDSGLRKRTDWEATWALQRLEDRGLYKPTPTDRGGDGLIPVPPTYVTGDFRRVEYWSNRGKLDVPKERFILYPETSREGDSTPVIGWAGWDHAQQALAVATLIQTGEQQGWPNERLTPLVAGLSEVLPWVQQWHTHPDPLYGGSSPAEFFSGMLDNYMAKLGATRESLAAWRPPAPARGRKAKS